MKKNFYLIALCFLAILNWQCNKNTTEENPIVNNPTPVGEEIEGFNILSQLQGIWSGPLTSTTGVGNFPKWIVDFRPISENQIAAKNELDKDNDILLSLFIAKINNEHKLCFRNGGSFSGQNRISYFFLDSLSENSTSNFYRFAEAINGKSKGYVTIELKNDSIYLKSYTNKYYTLEEPTLHISWAAKKVYNQAHIAAKNAFDFPKKTVTKDFTTAFAGRTQALYYQDNLSDPYPESAQPYLGKAMLSYSISNTLSTTATGSVLLFVTTQPILENFAFNAANLSTISRYVVLQNGETSFTFNYMHPGTYYVYAVYDKNSDLNIGSGDYMSLQSTQITLTDKGIAQGSVNINFTIP